VIAGPEELRQEAQLNRVVRESVPTADYPTEELKEEEELNRVIREKIPESQLD
jgi:hypothetical protein